MRPTKSQGDCAYCFNIKEEVILDQIEEVIKSIHIPETVLTQIKDHLKHLVSKQYTIQKGEIRKLEEQLQVSNERLKSTRLKFLDNTITAEEHTLWTSEERQKKIALEGKIASLRIVDDNFDEQVTKMFIRASKAHETWKSSGTEEKRRIISLLFPNLTLDGIKLGYTLKKPFDVLCNFEERSICLPSFNIFRNKQDDILSTMNRPMMEGVRLCLAA